MPISHCISFPRFFSLMNMGEKSPFSFTSRKWPVDIHAWNLPGSCHEQLLSGYRSPPRLWGSQPAAHFSAPTLISAPCCFTKPVTSLAIPPFPSGLHLPLGINIKKNEFWSSWGNQKTVRSKWSKPRSQTTEHTLPEGCWALLGANQRPRNICRIRRRCLGEHFVTRTVAIFDRHYRK